VNDRKNDTLQEILYSSKGVIDMNKGQFWQLISEMNQKEETSEWLVEHLTSQPTSEITDFEIHFQTALKESYTSSLWAAAYIIFGGCSDDLFDF